MLAHFTHDRTHPALSPISDLWVKDQTVHWPFEGFAIERDYRNKTETYYIVIDAKRIEFTIFNSSSTVEKKFQAAGVDSDWRTIKKIQQCLARILFEAAQYSINSGNWRVDIDHKGYKVFKDYEEVYKNYSQPAKSLDLEAAPEVFVHAMEKLDAEIAAEREARRAKNIKTRRIPKSRVDVSAV